MKHSLFLGLALVLSTLVRAQDIEAPMITSISVTPSVDVTSGDQVVSATVQITDDDSGFEFGNLFLYRPDGNFVSSHAMGSFQRTAGDSSDGTYVVHMLVPQYATAGTWEVRGFVEDVEGNLRNYGGTDEAFPVPADATFTVVNTGTVDTTAPALVSVSVAPSPINTGTVSRNIVVTLNITDALSGFRSASLLFRDPTPSFDFGISGFVFHTQVFSGDAQNGVYQINTSIPQGSLDGIWTFDISMFDQVGNRVTITEPAGATFEVNNTTSGAAGDLSDAVDATQYTWTTGGDQDWSPQSAETFDGVDAAKSGAIGDNEVSDMEFTLTGPGTLDFYWKVDSEEFNDILSVEVLGGGDYADVSGDVDWTSSSVTIPPGSQTVRFRYEKDGGGSNGADAAWVDRVCFSADADMEDPVIQRLSLSPNPVDLSGGMVEVTVTIEVSDDFNGFSDGYLTLTEVDSDNEYSSNSFDSADLISGDSKFGTYEVTFEFYPEDFDPEEGSYLEGTYRVSVELYEQVSGDTRFYGNGSDPFPIPSTEFFTVGGAPTGGAPILTGITSMSPGTVDVSAGDQSVTVEFGVVSTGVAFSYGDVSFFNPSGNFAGSVFFDSNDRISGNVNNGTYSVTFPIYEHSAPGTWKVAFFLSDFDNNTREYPREDGFPNPGEEEFTVINTGTVDATNPVLTFFSMTPTVVDTSASAQSIAVNLGLTDDLSGIESVVIYAYDPNDQFSGALYTSFPTSGLLSDTYSGSFDLPMGSLEGTWNAVVSVRDRAGNSIFYVGGSLGFGNPFPAPFVGQFTVGPVSGTSFENFASTFGLTGGDSLGGSNPDGDIYNNVLEFLLGLDPTVQNVPNSTLYEVVQVGSETRINFTIDPSLAVTINGDYLELSNGGSSPVSITGQTSTSFPNNWIDQLPTNVGGSSYRVTLPVTASDNGVVRLRFLAP